MAFWKHSGWFRRVQLPGKDWLERRMNWSDWRFREFISQVLWWFRIRRWSLKEGWILRHLIRLLGKVGSLRPRLSRRRRSEGESTWIAIE